MTTNYHPDTPDSSATSDLQRYLDWYASAKTREEARNAKACIESLIRATATAPQAATTEQAEKDNCKLCLGAKGGVPGNENVIGGVVVCDYCTSALMDMKAAGWFGAATTASASVDFEKCDLTDYSQSVVYSNSAHRAPAPSREADEPCRAVLQRLRRLFSKGVDPRLDAVLDEADAALAQPAAPVVDGELPPLPEGEFISTDEKPAFTPDQMREYGAACVAAARSAPVDPMDWPLPCDVKVGACTIKKGCKLRTLVTRMESLYRMAATAFPYDEEKAAEFWRRVDEIREGAAAPSHPEPAGGKDGAA